MDYNDHRIYLQENPESSLYSRFFQRDLKSSVKNYKIKRIPFDWSGFEHGYGLTFNHRITFLDSFIYSLNNPLSQEMHIRKRYFLYDARDFFNFRLLG